MNPSSDPQHSSAARVESRPGTAGASDHRLRFVLVALVFAGAAFYTWAEGRAVGGLGFPLDDSWIHLQFARSLAEGNGMAYRGGDLVSGSTAPLWTALLSTIFALGLPAVVATKLFGVVITVASVLAVFRLAIVLGIGRGLAFAAAAMVAVLDWTVWSALSGMEIPLFVWLSLEGIRLHVLEQYGARGESSVERRGRVAVAPAVLALAALARPEGLLLLVLAALEQLWRGLASGPRRRPGWPGRLAASWALAMVVLAPGLVLNLWAGGAALPTTVAVKGGAAAWPWPSLRHVMTVVEILFRPAPVACLLAGAGLVEAVRRARTDLDRGLLLPAWVLGLPLAYATLSSGSATLNPGNFGRYMFPLFAPMVVLAALGAQPAVERLRALAGSRRAATALGLLALAVASAPTLLAFRGGAGRYALNVRNVEESDVHVGRWLAENVPVEALVATQDIGAIGYFAPQPLLDLAGIVTPEILPYTRGALRGQHPSGLGGLFAFLEQRRPQVLVLFPASYGGLDNLASIEPGLQLVYRRAVTRNITMAGDELVVLRTPWQ